jgi:hypothetical protein
MTGMAHAAATAAPALTSLPMALRLSIPSFT